VRAASEVTDGVAPGTEEVVEDAVPSSAPVHPARAARVASSTALTP
jgi:hypothetical protein